MMSLMLCSLLFVRLVRIGFAHGVRKHFNLLEYHFNFFQIQLTCILQYSDRIECFGKILFTVCETIERKHKQIIISYNAVYLTNNIYHPLWFSQTVSVHKTPFIHKTSFEDKLYFRQTRWS